MLNGEELSDALHKIGAETDGVWPHDMAPFHIITKKNDGGLITTFFEGMMTEEKWNAYEYNPPEWCRAVFPSADVRTNVRPKPTWAEITAAAETASSNALLDSILFGLRAEAERRITEAYGETSFRGETELRLRGGHTPAQDAERDRIREKYKSLKASVEGMSHTQRQSFDPTDESHWSAPT